MTSATTVENARFNVADGSLSALKWLAVVLMALDHINKYLFNESIPCVFELGRIVMPVFGFVFAYNLARPGSIERGTFKRAIRRLAIYGTAATPICMLLGNLSWGWWPLNILFTFLLGAAILMLCEQGGKLRLLIAAALLLFGGAIVEFWWFALIWIFACYQYSKTSSYLALAFGVAALAALYWVNGNFWTLVAIPIIYIAAHLNFKAPRLNAFFYLFYPLHLAAILAIRW